MNSVIFLKSFARDFPRLDYAIRSVQKFASGFDEIIIAIPDGETYAAPGCRVVRIRGETRENGYLFQQCVKANVHDLTEASAILHIDSDCILTKPITPETFFRDGKPLWLLTPYASIQQGIDAQKAADPHFHCGAMTWKAVTEKFIGQPVEYELMRRMPMFVPRALHVAAAEFCKIKHKQSLTEYILSQPAKEFSEFNALGALAYYRAHDDFSWLDTTKEPLPESAAIQKWSHEPFSEETKAEFESILNGPAQTNTRVQCDTSLGADQQRRIAGARTPTVKTQSLPRSNADETGGVTAGETAFTPWKSKDESLAEIKSLAEQLQKFCTGGAKTRTVREELHRLRVIELPYRMRKRKGWRKRKAKV